MLKSVYINLEDDIPKITTRLKRERADEVVLVFPKKSALFADPINLKLLKKQIDVLGKNASILTMDEKGQAYAKEAGFKLKFLPKTSKARGFSDVKAPKVVTQAKELPKEGMAVRAAQSSIKEIKKLVKHIAPQALSAPKYSRTDNVFSDLYENQPETNLHAGTKKKTRFYNRSIFGFVAASLIIIILLVVVVLPKGDIVVYARQEPATRDVEINLSTKTTQADADKLAMPAVWIDRTVELRDKFSAAGKHDVGTKAEGQIAVYNLTGKTINLKAATSVLALGNTNYFFKADQQVKPSKESGEQAPVNIADIIADQGGENYNLPAGTRLEITNQVFGSHPQLLYAKTAAPIVGGTSRFISVITPEDVKAAQDSLTKSISKQITDELAGKNLIMPDGAFTSTVVDFNTDKQAGTESPNFEGYENLHVTGLAFDKTALDNLIRQRISKTLGTGKNLQDAGKDVLSYTVKNADFANQVMTIMVHFESQVISSVDANDIKSQIAGKTKQEASEILLSKAEISRVDITLSPGWQRSIPRLKQKISIEIK